MFLIVALSGCLLFTIVCASILDSLMLFLTNSAKNGLELLTMFNMLGFSEPKFGRCAIVVQNICDTIK